MFGMDEHVDITVETLINLVNLCVKMDRRDKPERVDYSDYVMSLLYRPSGEIEKMEVV